MIWTPPKLGDRVEAYGFCSMPGVVLDGDEALVTHKSASDGVLLIRWISADDGGVHEAFVHARQCWPAQPRGTTQ